VLLLNDFLFKKLIGKKYNKKDLNIRKRCGIISGVTGIILNLLLFFSKLIVAILSSSIATMADAFNNLSDAGSSIVTLICFRMAANPADKEHPFGHGRIEYISSLVVSIAIIITGLGFTKSSIEKIFNPENLEFDVVSLIILGLSVLLKVWMWTFNLKISKNIDSVAIKATASDSLADAAATLTVIFGFVVSHFTDLYLDPFAGLLVSFFVIFTGVKTLKESLSPLLGKAPDEILTREIKKFVLSYKEVSAIDELSVHNYGPNKSAVSLKIKTFSKLSTREVNKIVDMIEKDLEKKFGCSAIIRIVGENLCT